MLEEDAMQAALIGFLRALEKWDPAKGAWITCMFMWCRREVQDAQSDEPIVYRPQGVGKPYKIYRAEEAFYAREGRDATAKDLGASNAQLDKWRNTEIFVRESFDRPAKEENEQGAHTDGRTSMHRAAPSAYTPEMPRTAEELIELDEFENELRKLTPAEIEILLGSDCDEKEDLQAIFT
jgi:DNA-directed RNA polymerase specialized sigma subunit